MKKLLTCTFAFALLFGCGGDDNPLTPDAGDIPDAGPLPDAPPAPPQNVTVSGQVTKLGAYLAGDTEYAGGASVLALGVSPVQNTTSAEDGTVGAYSLTAPANGQVVFYTSKLGYFPTYTPVTVQQANVTEQKLYLTENEWLNTIAAAHNVDLNASFACHAPLDPAYQCVYGVVIGRILDDGNAGNGTLRPVAGITAEDFQITGGVNGDDWYVKGPYFLDPTGTANAGNLASVVVNDGGEYKGGLFVTFVEIPQINGPEAITVQVGVTYDDAAAEATRQFGPHNVQVYRSYGVTWSNVYETGVVPPPPPGPVDFDSQIYPLLLPVNQGGYGCQGCHTDQGGATPAGGMNLYGGPEAAYASLDPNAYPQRVNVNSPAESYLLKKPLYEAVGPQDHPIYAFASAQDPAYQLIYKWIAEGGQREVEQDPVSFRNDIRPLLYLPAAQGGALCYSCHVDGVNADNAPGGFYMGGTPEELHAELVTEAAADNGDTGEPYRVNKNGQPESSLLLINPLFGHPEPHPVKIFSSNLDGRYQLIYRWIQEGYQLD